MPAGAATTRGRSRRPPQRASTNPNRKRAAGRRRYASRARRASRCPAGDRGPAGTTPPQHCGCHPEPPASSVRWRRRPVVGELPVVRARASDRPRAALPAVYRPHASRDPSRDPCLCRPYDLLLLRLHRSQVQPPFTSETVALDLLIQIAARHFQCACRLGHVPIVLLQLHDQKRALGGQLKILKRPRAQPSCIAATCGQLRPCRFTLPDQPVDVRPRYDASGCKYEQSFDGILELANVTRPIVSGEPFDRRLFEILVHESTFREVGDKMVDELRDVRAPLAQRGNVDRDNVEAIEQVLTKPTDFDLVDE